MITNHSIPFLFLFNMDYQQTIDYLFSRLPMFSRIGAAAYKADLSNTIELCNVLDNPQQKFKTVHIAGTNGKGSVSHMLAAILQTAGYKTGLYTSPHLKDFRERIKIDGNMISEEFVIDFTKKIKPKIEKLEPSFFEITVAMAFDFFAQEKVDIAIIETGMGGRLDSTNIITPVVSVITNIGFDHMQFLGDTLEKIAFEKAGIIKSGVPVVVGEFLPETKPVFEKIGAEKKAPLSFASQKRMIADFYWEKNELICEVSETIQTDHKKYHLELTGIYQNKNLLTVLESCFQLQRKGWKISENDIFNGLRYTKKITGLHGRWDMIQISPTVILDVAHNTDGIQQLINQIELTEHKNLHLIIGMVKDKEVDKILELLPPYAIYYFTKSQIPRAINENELKKSGTLHGLRGNSFPDVNTALQSALSQSHQDDLIIISGSIFLIGEVNTLIH
ncbi:MAG: folylpolyglutamate synthase/dihydrofolate synthase family protein [Chitinophagaceae bacterium]